ncbi:MAG: hypothetical protein WA172_00160 [Terriglobales bacterium]
MARFILLMAFLFSAVLYLPGETATFTHVKIHRHKSAQCRVLVDKVGVLTFDDASQKLSFASGAGDQLDVSYDDITKVVFEVTTHMRGGGVAQVISAVGLPGTIAGGVLAATHVHDYWFYLEYKNGDHSEPVLLEIPADSSEGVIAKANAVFGARVTFPVFKEKGEGTDPEKLPDFNSNQKLKVDRINHPIPEPKPDQALIVVVCPPLAARYAGTGYQHKLHANGRVVAVNREGTYSFAYLDPGKYRLVSQAGDANGFEIELEAGKSYYFLQNRFGGGFLTHTVLTRNSCELVMYELDGSYFADWKRK